MVCDKLSAPKQQGFADHPCVKDCQNRLVKSRLHYLTPNCVSNMARPIALSSVCGRLWSAVRDQFNCVRACATWPLPTNNRTNLHASVLPWPVSASDGK